MVLGSDQALGVGDKAPEKLLALPTLWFSLFGEGIENAGNTFMLYPALEV